METLQIGEEMSGEVDDKNMRDDKEEGILSDGIENGIYSIHLLDFSDDVLLLILKNLPPRDLKALSFTCTKFASLVLERSLWRKVDARGIPCGTARFKWLLNAFHGDTTSIMLTGYAQQNVGCWGHHIPKEGQVEPKQGIQVEPAVPRVHEMQFCARNPFRRQHALFHIQARQLPRVVSTPAWPDEPKKEAWELVAKDFIPSDENQETGTCTGPRFTFTAPMFLKLIEKCPNLTTLVLEYCNLNCKTIHLSQLSSTLKTLSLKGLKCFNFLVDRSFLFKLQDALPNLETLDLSECDWLDPSSFLPLSKLNSLTRLRLCNCPRLSEFVAYSSLATRYGFRVLQELDLRGSPVSDSEVSSF
ncbi:PREDICTED: uncharacterized protein LOC106104440 [Papilio polytes]|uniref:uncharacterized protein LOC106104440 n=1 Tax=Papilio polytes TaxID=76194 RepID=UPI000675FE4C|nr:PREDICTED: uncharacterized protein LOC106104440 [Papilio polytes]